METEGSGPEPIRVLIADDQILFAKMLETVLAEDERIEVVGRAADGKEAVELTRSLAPDVVVMDITMPIMDGLEATRRIREQRSSARIVVLTESTLPGDVVRAQKAGAADYVPKARIASELTRAIVATAS